MPTSAESAVRHGPYGVSALFSRGYFEPVYDQQMPSNLLTTLAVSDAITHYRQLRELSCDELSFVLSMLGHMVSSDAIAAMGNRERPVTVDDLVAISDALGTSPAVLLTHIPINMPAPEGPLATGLPADVEPLELRAWAEGRTALGTQSRIGWWQDRVSRLRMLSTHHVFPLALGVIATIPWVRCRRQ